MRKYVFIKDEAYSSNLYTNFTEYLAKDDDLKCSFGGADKYKVKLLESEEARGLVGTHPMMLQAKHMHKDMGQISLVSFGGCIYEVNMELMMLHADNHGSVSLCSFEQGHSEADILSKAALYSGAQLKEIEKFGYMYLSMVRLKGTNVYYLILNPTLVQCAGHIEIEGDTWIEQIKGVKDTIKDSIFTMGVTPQLIGNHIVSGGLCGINMLENSVIQPEDREEFLNQLSFTISHRGGEDCSHQLNEGHLFLVHSKDTVLTVEVENELLGDYINDKEKLEWQYIVTSLGN